MATRIRDEALSRADAAWLHADEPTNHFVVTSLALLEKPLDLHRLRGVLARRIGLHPRLRQVVAEPLVPFATPRWVAAPHFDLDAHLHRLALPRPGGLAELAALLGDLVAQPLDAERPLWDTYAVEGPGEGGALISRFHHSLGDGHAMVRMLLTLTDSSPEGWRRPVTQRRPPRRGGGWRQLAATAGGLLERLPEAPPAAGALARLTFLDADRPTPLRGTLGLVKGVAWSEAVPLDRVKAVAAASGTTVNDVVVSAIAGGLGRHLRAAGQCTDGLRIRAMVPVDLRGGDDPAMTGNQFSLVYLELPVGVRHPWERLMRVKIEMDRIKHSPEPAVGWLLVQGMGLLPPRLERLISGFYAAKASLVLTNVVGPGRPLFIAGTRIEQMTFWEPESAGLGVGVSIYSYAGALTVGVIADARLVARPAAITDGFLKSFEELAQAAGVG